MAYSNPYPNVSTNQALQVISYRESGNQNIYNYMHATNPNYYTAGGYYQITNTTWQNGAKLAGVDTSQYPTAISAPPEVQTQVAGKLYETYGFSPWQGNPRSAADMATLNSGGSLSYVGDNTAPVGGASTTTLASTTPDTSGQGYGSSGTSTTGGGGASYTDPTTLQTYTVNPGSTSVQASGAGYGQTTNIAASPSLLSDLNTWITGLKNSVGDWMTTALQGVLGTVGNLFARFGLIILGIVLILVALWRVMDPSGEKTREVIKGAMVAA